MPHPRLSPSMLLKSSPYIGWFRHAPPAKITMQNIFSQRLALLDTRCQDKSFVREPQDQVTYDLANIINGRLRGGGNDKHCSLSSTHESDILRCAQHALQESYTESASGTVNMLARIGSWLLFPLAYDSESAGYKTFRHQGFDPIPEDSQSWTSSVDESSLADVLESEADSDGDTPGAVALTSSKAGTPVGCNSQPLDISVSNVAEAYYAHQAIGQVDDLSPDAHRLDYVITQMDIARMARNASRHLDVESILTLPTMTYKCLASAESSAQETHESWSFVMVTDDRAHCRTRQQGNFCVICMDHFVDGDRLRVLPCNHSFHVGCIDRWLSGSHSNFECFTSVSSRNPTLEVLELLELLCLLFRLLTFLSCCVGLSDMQEEPIRCERLSQ